MKRFLLASLFVAFGLMAWAQDPSTIGQTKVTYSVSSGTDNNSQNDKIHTIPASRYLKPGTDNVVQFSIDGVKDNQLLVKVSSESPCESRKGSKFGEYILTPKASEGTVVVRVGAMDFMGAFQKFGDIIFTIGEAPEEEPSQE